MLDGFARQGMRFSNTWAEPFCSPTRASILTGLFSAKTRVLTYADPLATHHLSFVQKLKDEGGYSTAIFGKWHIAGLPGRSVDYPGMKPKQAGFDLFRGNLSAAIKSYWDYDYQIQDADTSADKWRSEQPPTRSLPGIAPTNYAPVVKASDAIEWITAQEKSNPGKPWFTWLAFNLSHATAQRVPSQMVVPNADTLTPEAYREMQACGGTFGTANVGNCSGEALMRAMTNSVDTVIGKVLQAVDKLDPNTYVIYISDNGTPMYGRPNLDFIDNMYLTKRGAARARRTRAARACQWRSAARPSRRTRTAMPTSTQQTCSPPSWTWPDSRCPGRCHNSGGTGMVALDSVSLTPLLYRKAKSTRDPDRGFLLAETVNLMTADKTQQAGARNGSYKIVCTSGHAAANCEFFDLAKGPLEEYPLDKPASCDDYSKARLKMSDPAWNYCRLSEVIAKESFVQPGYVAQDTPGPGLPPQ